MNLVLKYLFIFCFWQVINASDPIDCFKAGTLRVNLAAGFSAAEALGVVDSTLKGIPVKKFAIKGLVDDSWQRKSQIFLMSDGSTRDIPNSDSDFSRWLSGVSQWDKVNFTKLCAFAFGINAGKENKDNKISYDAVIYLQAFMRQHFAGQTLAENNALDFAANILDLLVEQDLLLKNIKSLGASGENNYFAISANHSKPFFCSTYIGGVHENFAGFLKGMLSFYCTQKVSELLIQTVWAQYYLEHYFRQTRGEMVFKSKPYKNLESALIRNIALLGFQAEQVSVTGDALARHFAFLSAKRWCDVAQYFEWGDLLVSGKCKIGLYGEVISDHQKVRECAHSLFRCAWVDVPDARVLLAENIIDGVKLDAKGKGIDTRKNPNAHYEYAAGILRDFLRMSGQSEHIRAKAFDKLATLAMVGQITADEENRLLFSREERFNFARRCLNFAIKNYSSKKMKAYAGIKLLQSYLGVDTSIHDSIGICKLLEPLYGHDPFIKSQFCLVFGQLAVGGKWSVKQKGTVFEESDRAAYSLECFTAELAALDEFTNDIDRNNTITNRMLAGHNMARILVKNTNLMNGDSSVKWKRINDLLQVPVKCGMYSSLSDEGFNSLFGCHVVKGLAYLNILGDEGKAVEEFRQGALKGEYGAYEYYMRHSGIPFDDFFVDDSDIEEDEGNSEEITVVQAAQALTGPAAVSSFAVDQEKTELVVLEAKQKEEMALFLMSKNEAEKLATEREEKRKILEARKAEKLLAMQRRIEMVTERPLEPLSGITKIWQVVHVGEGARDYGEIFSRSEADKSVGGKNTEMVRYLTLVNAVQSNDRTGHPEILSGVCLADGAPIFTRRFSHGDRMVYTVNTDERGNNTLTIHGLKGHDGAITHMLRTGIAKNK